MSQARPSGDDIVIGYGGGKSDAFGVYDHKPWQKGYKDEERERRETEAEHTVAKADVNDERRQTRK